MKRINVRDLVYASLFLSMGLVLPLLTGQVKEIGDSLLPMHLPVMLCGLICGPWYGSFVGLILPFMRSIIFGMPPLYPQAVWMSVELFTYGLVIGLVFLLLGRRGIVRIYISLVTAMILGRITWGIAKTILLGLSGKGFTLTAFWVGGFVDALPGIVLQLILVPTIATFIFRYRDKRDLNKLLD